MLRMYNIMAIKVKHVRRIYGWLRVFCLLTLVLGFVFFVDNSEIYQNIQRHCPFVMSRKTKETVIFNKEEIRMNIFFTNTSEQEWNQSKVQSGIQRTNDKIFVENTKSGRRIFHIKNLPPKKLKEIRQFLSVTHPPEKLRRKKILEAKSVYKKRKQWLLQSCEGYQDFEWTDDMQLITAPDKALTVCVVQKAGSSSWHRLVHKLREPNGTWSGETHNLNRKHGMSLDDKIRYSLMKNKTATRVLTVRHPFSRLLSGWNNKFHKNHLLASTRILSQLHGIERYINSSRADSDHIIAFEDFIQYLVDKGLENVDVHFRTIEQLCRPCSFPYDYVTKTETSLEHSWYVLYRVGGQMPTFTKHMATGSGYEEIEQKQDDPWKAEQNILSIFFKRLPLATIRKLYIMYKVDFDRFGYTFNMDTMVAGDKLG